ncbi:MAG TPA: ribonuclease III [Spirochaetota bacterium]|nr:ribonuclease III [Spirochaetota bacterium]
MRGSNKNISKKRHQELVEFQRSLGIRFRNLAILNTALSHKSYVNELEGDLENYEKLEFLGDSFLGLVVSDYLYNQEIYLKEGTLARIKSYVVSESTLYSVGKTINIQKYLLLGKGEEKSGGRHRKALIGDSIEALIGAYYIDGGFSKARKLVERLFAGEIENVEKNRHVKDYKSILQEYAQKRYKVIPHYTIINTEGPDHRRKFYVNVTVGKRTYGPGIGESKKQAEQNAASMALGDLLTHKRLRDPNIERSAKHRQTLSLETESHKSADRRSKRRRGDDRTSEDHQTKSLETKSLETKSRKSAGRRSEIRKGDDRSSGDRQTKSLQTRGLKIQSTPSSERPAKDHQSKSRRTKTLPTNGDEADNHTDKTKGQS